MKDLISEVAADILAADQSTFDKHCFYVVIMSADLAERVLTAAFLTLADDSFDDAPTAAWTA